MQTSGPNMSVLALVFQTCIQSGVFLLDHLVFIQCVFFTYNQNMKLLLVPLNVTYQELFHLIVCDINNKECIVHRCPNCPESNTLLQDVLFHTIGNFDDDDDVIEFSQWATTDQSNLTIQKLLMSMYVNIVIEQLHILTVHSYISKCQFNNGSIYIE